MTTIAYRDGIMAADTASFAGITRAGSCRKIARNAAGDLAGACGTATYMGVFLRWFESGEDGPAPEAKHEDDCTDLALIVRRDGRVTVYEPGGSFEQRAPFFALGSGSAEAKGAMYMGASALVAVCAAIDLDAYTAGPITVLSADGERDDVCPAPMPSIWA